MSVELVSRIINEHMTSILRMFKPGAKITILVRFPGLPDRDFMMTDDDPREAIDQLERSLVTASVPFPTSDPVGFPDEQVKS